MVTHHGGTGQLPERTPIPHEQDPDTPSEDIDNFKNEEHETHTTMKTLTREIDHLPQRIETAKDQPMEVINCLECELHRLFLTLSPLALLEPLDDVLQQYTETLCTAQKKTTFVTTLVQDIPTSNGSNMMQLENWLVDTETAANLTDKSRTKLAQAKSKGLTPTLITEAISLGKNWEEIRDLLHLKISNSDIHTSISCFMVIQQKDKESLAAYIHRFKREAKRCNFTKNAATIRIFVKGLKNAHTLDRIYEKGPQTLTDAISEEEKLQAAEQLTATLLPSSAVNVMTNEGDQCFQCQELGHLT